MVVSKGLEQQEGWELGIKLIEPPSDFWGLDCEKTSASRTWEAPKAAVGEERRRSHAVMIRMPVSLARDVEGRN